MTDPVLGRLRLKYSLADGHPDSAPDVVTQAPTLLAAVHSVSAWLDRDGRLRVWVEGPMRRRDGVRSRVRRTLPIYTDEDVEQPEWLQAIIDDAGERLQ